MRSLAERLLAEEVPNNKVPDGAGFPEWGKDGTPPSQIEEGLATEPDTLTVSVGRVDGPGSAGMVEFYLSPDVQPGIERQILEAIAAIQIHGLVGAEIHAR